jgi:hypothetical protein
MTKNKSEYLKILVIRAWLRAKKSDKSEYLKMLPNILEVRAWLRSKPNKEAL